MATHPIRAVRVPEELWRAAQREAAQRGETVTAAILRGLTSYTQPATAPMTPKGRPGMMRGGIGRK